MNVHVAEPLARCPNCGSARHSIYFRPAKCGVAHCDIEGCEDCMGRCEVAEHGLFCRLHLNEISMPGLRKPIVACLACEADQQREEAEERMVLREVAA